MSIKNMINRNKPDSIQHNKRSKVMLGIAVALLILFSVFTYHTFTSPEHIERVTYKNYIRQQSDYSYKIDVVPSSLYPHGGIIVPEHRIFTRITKGLILNIHSFIKAEKPIAVNGNYKIIAKITAEDLWEKEYAVLKQGQYLSKKGTEISLIDDEIYIPISDIFRYTEEIENELDFSPDQYKLSIIPVIEGTIKAGDKSNPIASPPELTFAFTSREITPISELNFVNDNPIKETEVLSSGYSLMGLSISLSVARLVSSILTLVPLTYIVYFIANVLKKQKKNVYESVAIDLKYKNRLINLKRSIDFSGKCILILDDFKSLVRIADEKEMPILRFEDSAANVDYYVIDGQCIYNYRCDNNGIILQSKGEEQTIYA
ncbi:MAG: DUF5305 domain-containing protein [Clostridiales bacterium]|nr:DUF5305 domain-containing protein [Clostridiales bacterium]